MPDYHTRRLPAQGCKVHDWRLSTKRILPKPFFVSLCGRATSFKVGKRSFGRYPQDGPRCGECERIAGEPWKP